jgi:hypothetical protein
MNDNRRRHSGTAPDPGRVNLTDNRAEPTLDIVQAISNMLDGELLLSQS